MNKYSFKKYQLVSLRIWHWINALAIVGLLATVLLRKTFLSWRSNAALIENKLREAGTAITPELAKEIAVSIRSPMWDWHYILGFVLAAALLGRILIFIFVDRKKSTEHFLKRYLAFSKVPSSEKTPYLHYTFVKTGYAIFYLLTFFMVITGFTMYFKESLNLPKSFIETVKELHELTMWFFVVFTAGHIMGVIIAENRQDQGIVSDMISGGKKTH